MSEKNQLSITPSYYYSVQLYVCTMTRCEFTVIFVRENSPTGMLKQKRWFPQPTGQLTRDGDWESSCLFLRKLSRTRSIDGKFINSFFAINMLMLPKPTNSISTPLSQLDISILKSQCLLKLSGPKSKS